MLIEPPIVPLVSTWPGRSARRHLLRTAVALFAVTVTVSGLIASMWTLWRPSSPDFGRNLASSLSIGLSILGLSLTSWLVPQLRPPLLSSGGLAGLLLATIPSGYFLGRTLAAWLLDSAWSWREISPRAAVAFAATALASGLLAYVAIVRDRLAREAKARARIQQLATESELRFLQAQLEPHMLFNTLANLRSLVEFDPLKSQVMIDSMIAYFRGALDSTRRGQDATLESEFALLAAYLDIMKIRMGARLTVQLTLPEALRESRLPSMLLQPLLENAIKHGVEPKVGPVAIQVEASQIGNGFCVTIADTGVGLDSFKAAPAPSSGYGLSHVRERLHVRYGGAASLELTDNLPHGARATVKVNS